MKQILLVCLLVASPMLAAQAPPLPSSKFCFQVNGLDDGCNRCNETLDYSALPTPVLEERMRADIWLYGFEVANSLPLSPPSPELESRRGLGRTIMSAAPDIAFPELGDPITKDTQAVAYCSSTVGNGLAKPFDVESVKSMGKGRCAEVLVVYVKGLSEGC